MSYTKISLSKFLPHVRQYAPSVPNPVALDHLRIAANIFCTKTRCWREIVTVSITDKPVGITPSNTVIVAIDQVKMGGRTLSAMSFDDIDLDEFDDLTIASQATHFSQIHENEITVFPLVAGDVKILLYLAPVAGSEFGAAGALQDEQNKVPDFLFNNYSPDIAAGALARILLLPGQTFTDPAMAGVHMANFNAGINRAKITKARGQGRKRLLTKTTPF